MFLFFFLVCVYVCSRGARVCVCARVRVCVCVYGWQIRGSATTTLCACMRSIYAPPPVRTTNHDTNPAYSAGLASLPTPFGTCDLATKYTCARELSMRRRDQYTRTCVSDKVVYPGSWRDGGLLRVQVAIVAGTDGSGVGWVGKGQPGNVFTFRSFMLTTPPRISSENAEGDDHGNARQHPNDWVG